MSGIERMLEEMAAPSPPAAEVVTVHRILAEAALAALEDKGAPPSEVLALRGILAEPAPQLWAIHSVGPGEEYPCLNREDAEHRAQELRATGDTMKAERIARGESIEHWHDWVTNVIPSPWEPAEHFEIMAQEWMDDADQLRSEVIKLMDQNKELLESLTNLVGLAKLGAAQLGKYHAALAHAESVIAKATQ
ncbi:hypothetical protein ABH906_004235 [Pseudomonas frederiksbergensis]